MKLKTQLKLMTINMCCLALIALITLVQIGSDRIRFEKQTAQVSELKRDLEILKNKGVAPDIIEEISQDLSTIKITQHSRFMRICFLIFCVAMSAISMRQIINKKRQINSV
jgi:hypothetical protein